MSDKTKAAAVAQEAEVVQDTAPLRSETTTPGVGIETIWGPVLLFGAHLISPKFIVVLHEMFRGWGEFRLREGLAPMHHGVHIIELREDDEPKSETTGKSIHAHASPTVGGIAINLEYAFDESLDTSIEVPAVSIYANIWYNLIVSMAHEMYHLNSTFNNAQFTEKGEEAKAAEFARDFIHFLAQGMYDIEPTPLADEPYFSGKILTALQMFCDSEPEGEQASEGDIEFCKEQKMKSLEGIMAWYKDEEGKNDQILKSFREYVHWSSGDKLDDPAWAKVYEKPAPVEAAPTPAPVEAAAPVVAQPAPAVASPTIEMNAYTDTESEVHEIDPYIEMAMDDMGAYASALGAPVWEVEADLASLPASVVAAPFVTPQPVAVAAPAPSAAPAPALMPNSSGMAHGLSPAEVGACCMLVYRRLFNNLFTKCEQVNIDNTTIRPDGAGGGCGGFNNIAAIQEPITISDIPNADKVFVQMDAKVGGKWSKGVAIAGAVIGSDTGPKTLLPKYDLYLINDQGHMEKRTLLPQNPWKTKQTDAGLIFSKPAGEAQNGKRIMYIYSQDVMKLKVLAEKDASNNWREWLEDANWNIIG